MTEVGKFIFDTLADAARFPLHLRIAVKLRAAGYTEQNFIDAMVAGDFSVIPQPLLYDVANAVRDIERTSLPKLSNTSAQRLAELGENL